ncbi:LysR family transcriptional regulator [Novosphingobium flavum]|uniref:LysR family transcriptional regulator n=1 Tax=Novosphingobium flavum TaxID=1778672 RepID=A0A7X1FS25_9SPHN|nr:LysR family transcriptional regulator [Novosphingobium flavum]MBC2665903.1 LysR family transcriptional regulator [Novosphingobium flavum]
MADVARPTLDQLAILLAVAEQGSFNGAARQMGRAVSAISYGIAGLEAQLGVRLFDREGSRRPVLTEAGKAVLTHARAIGDGVDDLIAGVRAYNEGLETCLGLAIDVMVPQRQLSGLLRDFELAFPTVDLTLHVEGLGAVAGLVLDGRAQLAVAGPATAGQPLLELQALGDLELVPVAAPAHPLARMERIEPGIARRYRQLVLTDRSSLTEGQDFGVFAARTWRLGDLGAKHALLLEGIGWGNMPRHMVEADLAAGRLVILPVPEGRSTAYPIWAAWQRGSHLGPAARWIRDELGARFHAQCGPGA